MPTRFRWRVFSALVTFKLCVGPGSPLVNSTNYKIRLERSLKSGKSGGEEYIKRLMVNGRSVSARKWKKSASATRFVSQLNIVSLSTEKASQWRPTNSNFLIISDLMIEQFYLGVKIDRDFLSFLFFSFFHFVWLPRKME